MSESQPVVANDSGDAAAISVLHPSAMIQQRHDTPRPVVKDDSAYCPPTRPVTPVPRRRHNNATPSDSPLPIIAPPSFESIPKPPVSQEAGAEVRIRRLKEKDMEQRAGDGLTTLIVTQIESPRKETHDAEEQMMWQVTDDPDSDCSQQEQQPMEVVQDEDYENMKLEFGIVEDFRADVVEWMLDVSRLNTVPSIVSLIFTSDRSAERPIKTHHMRQPPCTTRGLPRYPLARRTSLHAVFPPSRQHPEFPARARNHSDHQRKWRNHDRT